MDNSDSIESRQNAEFCSLEAIYGEDQLKDLRTKAAWNAWTPLNLSLTIGPQKGESMRENSHIKVDLHVICSAQYPNEVPQILLENEAGISKILIDKISEKLMSKARELVGSEMIFELATLLAEFLYDNSKPPMESFYAEMINQKERQRQKEVLEKEKIDDRKKRIVEQEIKQRREMLKLEEKMTKVKRKSLSESESQQDISSSKCKWQNKNTTNDLVLCDYKGPITLNFKDRVVQKGRCLRHINSNNIVFLGFDTQKGSNIEISQYDINVKLYSTEIKQVLTNIEQEMTYLQTLSHKNLEQYFGVKREMKENIITIYILKEFIQGSTCNALFTLPNITVAVDWLKFIAKGVLNALDYIHRNNVVHRGLNDLCVVISDASIIKVTDCSIPRRFSDALASIHASYNRKTDIYDFGKFVLGLLGQRWSSDDKIEIPRYLEADLYSFLTKCLNENEKERYTALQLLQHPFLHNEPSPWSPVHLKTHSRTENEILRDTNLILSNIPKNGQSRILEDFELLEQLGKGAYGSVLKVRNKLDGGYYAIKRILLNPKRKALNKKILVEAKLLSRLNHENVVRYYNSWIESCEINDSSTAETSNLYNVSSLLNQSSDQKKELNLKKNFENFNVSVTYDAKAKSHYGVDLDDEEEDEEEDDDEDDDDEEDDEPKGLSVDRDDSSSDYIVFERDSKAENSLTDDEEVSIQKSPVKSQSNTIKQISFMYIQMEFCEKSTLRTAIDGNLYLEKKRVWRLFREIVEGLAHIHQQGMIHRDLKPVNIFLDSSDHVKIGDFGLATTIANRTKQGDIFNVSKGPIEFIQEDCYGESKTGKIGTALYVAPEIDRASKVIYNQKVDIFSLGVILFEMFYHPMKTLQERSETITRLRTVDVIFPGDFEEKNREVCELLRWMLNHDTTKRPTAHDILQSKYVPPPVLEERQLQEFITHTINNPQFKSYKYLISSCFQQAVTHAQDVTYHVNCVPERPLNLFEFVKKVCIKIFRQHGAQDLATPLLMPKTRFYDNTDTSVKLMTHSGNIVLLPHDLRVPFARYLVLNEINVFRRYAIERVFKERKTQGFTPREFYECAFDIVTPTKGNLMSDAECLCVVHEIIQELPGVNNLRFLIRLNHTSLLKAIMLYCGMKDKHEQVVQILKDTKTIKSQIEAYLIQRELPDHMIRLFQNFILSEFEVNKFEEELNNFIKKKIEVVSDLAKCALYDIKKIIKNAQAFGVHFDFVIAPGFVYNFEQYSGMMCEIVYQVRKKKRNYYSKEVLAVGGRYDEMIKNYFNTEQQHSTVSQSAVGISISLDKLVQAVQQQEYEENIYNIPSIEIAVCSVESRQCLHEKTKILKRLWAAGFVSVLVEGTTTEEVQDRLLKLGVRHAVIIQDDCVRVKTWESNSSENINKFQEKTYSFNELLDNIGKLFKRPSVIKENIHMLAHNSSNSSISRLDSKTSHSEKSDSEQNTVLIHFLEKSTSSMRRRIENQINAQLENLLKKLNGFIIVLALQTDSNTIKTLTSCLDLESDDMKIFWASVEEYILKEARSKKIMKQICQEIWNFKSKNPDATIILYNLNDNFYRCII